MITRWILAAASLAAIVVVGACGATVTPSPAPAIPTPTERLQIFYAHADESPLAVPLDIKAGMTIDQRVHARFAALATAPWFGPGLSFNVLRDAARLDAVAVEGDLAVLDFNANEGEWGLNDRRALRAFLAQVVCTATDECVHKVRLTQNGGEDAVIATVDAIITYRAPLTREIVTPRARPDHSVAYFARDLDLPIAVHLEGAGIGCAHDPLQMDQPETQRDETARERVTTCGPAFVADRDQASSAKCEWASVRMS